MRPTTKAALITLALTPVVPAISSANPAFADEPSHSVFVTCFGDNQITGYHPGNEDGQFRTIYVIRDGIFVWINSEISPLPENITKFDPNANFIVEEGDEIWYPTVSNSSPFLTVGTSNCGSSTTTVPEASTTTSTTMGTTSTTGPSSTSTTETTEALPSTTGISPPTLVPAPETTLPDTGRNSGPAILIGVLIALLGTILTWGASNLKNAENND